jgi:CO/xanthine dehydrogenase Mo-binding subunit
MTVGELLRRAAVRLKNEWKAELVQVIEERFVEPDFIIPFDIGIFKGDAYPTYSWSADAIEVEVDTYTGETKILGAWGVYDVGVPTDMNIIQGQMQGGLLQGIGYASMEQLDCNNKGIIRNNSFSDYLIPTSRDVPRLVTEIINNPYCNGPYGGKGAGELPLVGAAPAYLEAMENALDTKLNIVPFTQEDTLRAAQGVYVK